MTKYSMNIPHNTLWGFVLKGGGSFAENIFPQKHAIFFHGIFGLHVWRTKEKTQDCYIIFAF